jgi:hypothetical protein
MKLHRSGRTHARAHTHTVETFSFKVSPDIRNCTVHYYNPFLTHVISGTFGFTIFVNTA